jgi:hypothetical protein
MMQRGTELVAIPTEPQAPPPSEQPSAAAARPLSGPIVPLTASATASQDLLGAPDFTANANPRSATRVLVKGEPLTPPAGRSDDFRWPRRGIAAFGTDPAVATTTDPMAPVAALPTIAAAPAPGAATVNPSGKKTNGRGQPPRQRTVQPQPRRQSLPLRGSFDGGGFGFGRPIETMRW